MANRKSEQKGAPLDQRTLRKAERTRQAILDTALKFLWSKPFRDLNVSELMEQVGVSRPVFYQYFPDVHALMECLLKDLEQEILEVADPWLSTSDDGASRLGVSIWGLVQVCHRQGPIIRAVAEAAPMDQRLEKTWRKFLKVFDRAVADRIRRDQAQGVVADFDPLAMAIALNRMDVATFIHHFGQRPRSKPGPVFETISRLWVCTIYGGDALDAIEKPC